VNPVYEVTAASESVRIKIEKPGYLRIPELLQSKAAPLQRFTPLRDPASTASVSGKYTPLDGDYKNARYSDSKLCLEGATFTMYSRDQVEQGQSDPVALTAGIRWIAWRGSNGAEASLKTRLVDIAHSPGGKVSPLQAEVRYHRRWRLPFSPFSKLDGSQISAIVGYEIYRNSGDGPFSPHYDLLKTGLDMEFPLLRSWDTGGELLYGYGLDASRKYEISGHINYYIKKAWSVGVGYRVHLLPENGSSQRL
jgi:hypothetical protein